MENGAKVKNVVKRGNVKRRNERRRKNGRPELYPTGESMALFQRSMSSQRTQNFTRG
jgi:hypothetical protein